MVDKWGSSGLLGPVNNAVAVTPHDTNELVGPEGTDAVPRCIYVGVSGDVSMIFTEGGTAVVFKSMPVGTHAYRPLIIKAAGTTATDIVACY